MKPEELREEKLEEVTGGGYETKRAFTPGGREGIICHCSHPAKTEKYDPLYGYGSRCPYGTTSDGSCTGAGSEASCKYFSVDYF